MVMKIDYLFTVIIVITIITVNEMQENQCPQWNQQYNTISFLCFILKAFHRNIFFQQAVLLVLLVLVVSVLGVGEVKAEEV